MVLIVFYMDNQLLRSMFNVGIEYVSKTDDGFVKQQKFMLDEGRILIKRCKTSLGFS